MTARSTHKGDKMNDKYDPSEGGFTENVFSIFSFQQYSVGWVAVHLMLNITICYTNCETVSFSIFRESNKIETLFPNYCVNMHRTRINSHARSKALQNYFSVYLYKTKPIFLPTEYIYCGLSHVLTETLLEKIRKKWSESANQYLWPRFFERSRVAGILMYWEEQH